MIRGALSAAAVVALAAGCGASTDDTSGARPAHPSRAAKPVALIVGDNLSDTSPAWTKAEAAGYEPWLVGAGGFKDGSLAVVDDARIVIVQGVTGATRAEWVRVMHDKQPQAEVVSVDEVPPA